MTFTHGNGPPRRNRQHDVRWFRLMVGISVLGVLGLVNVHLRGLVIKEEYELQRVEQNIAQQQQDIEAARIRISELESPERIEAWARRSTGMVRPSHVIYVAKSTPVTEAVAVNQD